MLEIIATSANDRRVYFDCEKSHAATHFKKNPLLKLALEKNNSVT
jgi:hypothetical protein